MRHEFSKAVRKAAEARANGRCEANGLRYGFPPGVRCTMDLSLSGIEHDHYPLGAHAEGSNRLDNDVVCCPACNQFAANHTDKAVEAKIKRIVRKHGPIELRRKTKPIPSRKAPMPSRPFARKP